MQSRMRVPSTELHVTVRSGFLLGLACRNAQRFPIRIYSTHALLTLRTRSEPPRFAHEDKLFHMARVCINTILVDCPRAYTLRA